MPLMRSCARRWNGRIDRLVCNGSLLTLQRPANSRARSPKWLDGGHVAPMFYVNRVLLMGAALRHALPTIVPERDYVEAGGLLSLAIDNAEFSRVFAYLMDKILRGARPADLPVQQPSRFVLSINLKTAKALGLTIPQSLLLRADQVVQ